MGVVGRLDQYSSMLAYEFDEYSMSENLLTYSEQFDNTSWVKNNYNVTANAITVPDGTLTADKLIAINASTFHDIYKSPGLSSNTYTLSIFAKAVEQSFIQVRIDDGVLSRVAMFNLSTGSVSSSSNVTSTSITSYLNGWYRCSITVTSAVINTVFNSFPTSSNGSYSGDGVSGIYIWGAQLEAGSVATDYTPTTTTTINRVLASTTNTNITGLGTYYSSGFDENVGFTTFLSANVFPPYDPVYDEFGGTLFGAGQGRYMRQNTDKSVIVYNEIDEISDFRDIVRSGLVLDLDAGMNASFNNTGTTWTDLSGNGNTGTLTNGPTYSSSNGGSIVFDGVDDYVSGSIPTINSWSVSLWYLSTDITSKVIFYPFSGTTTAAAALGFGGTLNATTNNRWYFYDGTTVISNSNTAVTTNIWYNLVVTKSSTTYNLYTNSSLSLNTTGVDVSLTQYNLGRRADGFWYSKGNISQASIYNRALSAAEIQQNYNALRNRYGL